MRNLRLQLVAGLKDEAQTLDFGEMPIMGGIVFQDVSLRGWVPAVGAPVLLQPDEPRSRS